MKVIKEEINFNCSADKLWEILSDIRRCDWIPSVEMIEVNGDCRVFEMLGMGKIKERILTNDAKEMKLQYSAVETRTPINHHLATMQIFKLDKNKCTLFWTTEIEPEIFADAIHKGMLISIDGIKKVILE